MNWLNYCMQTVLFLTQQLHSSGQTVDIDEGPEWLCGPNAAEEQHGAGIVDAVKYSPLLIHPEGNKVSFVCELFWQGLGPEAALGYQVRAGIFGQGVGIDSRRVLRSKAQAESATPAALLFSYLKMGTMDLLSLQH